MNKVVFFVSVGTHPQQFNRLLEEADKIAARKKNWKFFAQTGHSDYKMKNAESRDFWSGSEYNKIFEKASVIVCHAGAGTIINALELGKKLVVVPRITRFGEHTDNHQQEIAEALANAKKVITVKNICELEEAMEKALKSRSALASSRKKLVKRIQSFLGEIQ